jgi:hypothetical protein
LAMDYIKSILDIVTLLAILTAIWQLLFHARQMHRDLEMHFVDQYWEIMRRASNEWRLTYLLEPPKTLDDRRVAHEYLQLCEDEIDLRANARVTDSTWFIWAGSIASMVAIPHFADSLRNAPDIMYPKLRVMMSQPAPEKHDPCVRSRVWRRFHGL